LNPGVGACVGNCGARPWEPHKYPSREAQDANPRTPLDRVRECETREDEFSPREHRRLFDAHGGKKVEYGSNEEVSRGISADAQSRARTT
jgi:hypothetical protein